MFVIYLICSKAGIIRLIIYTLTSHRFPVLNSYYLSNATIPNELPPESCFCRGWSVSCRLIPPPAPASFLFLLFYLSVFSSSFPLSYFQPFSHPQFAAPAASPSSLYTMIMELKSVWCVTSVT